LVSDGKYIYFSSDRKIRYTLGMQESSIYRASLDWFDQAYKSEKFDNLFVEEKRLKEREKEEKTILKALTINPEGFLERIELVTDRFGYQTNPLFLRMIKSNFYSIIPIKKMVNFSYTEKQPLILKKIKQIKYSTKALILS
jgi:hypothetical protein